MFFKKLFSSRLTVVSFFYCTFGVLLAHPLGILIRGLWVERRYVVDPNEFANMSKNVALFSIACFLPFVFFGIILSLVKRHTKSIYPVFLEFMLLRALYLGLAYFIGATVVRYFTGPALPTLDKDWAGLAALFFAYGLDTFRAMRASAVKYPEKARQE